MGYWLTDEEGHSFAEREDAIGHWGDSPADIMCDALDKIIETFREEIGHSPTEQELIAGLKFSMEGALQADEDKRRGLKPYHILSEWRWAKDWWNIDGKQPYPWPDEWNAYADFIDALDEDDAKLRWERRQIDKKKMEHRFIRADEVHQIVLEMKDE